MMVFITVGTDVHPFARLVGWVDALAQARPDVEFIVQHGASPPPEVATAIDYVDHTQLIDFLSTADAVVTHGGPATIMEAREHHGRPIAVPRDPVRGEHIDGHQLAFCQMLADNHRVSLARTKSELEMWLERHLSGEIDEGLDPATLPVGIGRFIEEVDKVMALPPRRWSVWGRFSRKDAV